MRPLPGHPRGPVGHCDQAGVWNHRATSFLRHLVWVPLVVLGHTAAVLAQPPPISVGAEAPVVSVALVAEQTSKDLHGVPSSSIGPFTARATYTGSPNLGVPSLPLTFRILQTPTTEAGFLYDPSLYPSRPPSGPQSLTVSTDGSGRATVALGVGSSVGEYLIEVSHPNVAAGPSPQTFKATVFDSAGVLALDSRDRMIHGRIVAPPGVNRVGFRIRQLGGVDFGTYDDLLDTSGAPTPSIYASEGEIFHEGEEIRLGDPAYEALFAQEVLIIRDPEDPTGRTFDLYAVFDEIAPVELDLLLEDAVVHYQHALTREEEFAEWIDTYNVLIQWRPEPGPALHEAPCPELEDDPAVDSCRGGVSAAAIGVLGSSFFSEVIDKAHAITTAIVNRGLVLRPLLDVYKRTLSVEVYLVKGVGEGVWEGVQGDVEGVRYLYESLRHPIQRARQLWNLGKDFIAQAETYPGGVTVMLQDCVRNSLFSLLDNTIKDINGKSEAEVPFFPANGATKPAYIVGYVGGLAVEKVAVAILTTAAGKAATGGLKALAFVLQKSRAGPVRVMVGTASKLRRFSGAVIKKAGGLAADVGEVTRVNQMLGALSRAKVVLRSGAEKLIGEHLGTLYFQWAEKVGLVKYVVDNDWAGKGAQVLTKLSSLNAELAAQLSDSAARGFLRTYSKLFDVDYDTYLSAFLAVQNDTLGAAATKACLEVFDDPLAADAVKEMNLSAANGTGRFFAKNAADLDPEIAAAKVARAKAAAPELLKLPKAQREQVYAAVQGYVDNPSTVGEASRACEGIAGMTVTPGVGAGGVVKAMDDLGNASQPYLHAAGKTLDLDNSVPAEALVRNPGTRKVQDSHTSMITPHVPSRHDSLIATEFPGADGMKEFHALIHMDPAGLTDLQKTKLKRVRDEMARSTQNETLVKVMSPVDAQVYLNDPAERVFGYVSRAPDVDDLQTPAEYFMALRLDYKNTHFTIDGRPDGQLVDEMFQLEIPPQDIPVEVPYHQSLDSTKTYATEYPGTNNGFASNTRGRVQPEYHMGKGVSHPLPEGTRLRRITASGGKESSYLELRGGAWVEVTD